MTVKSVEQRILGSLSSLVASISSGFFSITSTKLEMGKELTIFKGDFISGRVHFHVHIGVSPVGGQDSCTVSIHSVHLDTRKDYGLMQFKSVGTGLLEPNGIMKKWVKHATATKNTRYSDELSALGISPISILSYMDLVDAHSYIKSTHFTDIRTVVSFTEGAYTKVSLKALRQSDVFEVCAIRCSSTYYNDVEYRSPRYNGRLSGANNPDGFKYIVQGAFESASKY